MSFVLFTEQGTTPDTPGTSTVRGYVGSDGLFRTIDDAGAVTVYSGLKPAPDVILEDQKTSGTSAGTSASGTWYAATINTIVHDPDSLVTLASNTFTFSVDGYIEWGFTFLRPDNFRTRLLNATDFSEDAISFSEYSNQATENSNAWSRYRAFVTAGKDYRIDRKVSYGVSTYGYGFASSMGVEKYGYVHFWRT